jgi:hypothetical protein
MKKIFLVITISIFAVSLLSFTYAQTNSLIPSWIKNTASFWVDDQISDQEFLNALQFLVNEGILVIPSESDESLDTEVIEIDVIDDESKENLVHNLDLIIFKIQQMQELSKNTELIQAISDSNSQFSTLDEPYEYINEKDEAWQSASESEITPFMESIIKNHISDSLRKYTVIPSEKFGDLQFPEIFVTNAYGANVAQTGKTSDYYQSDEGWWLKGKNESVYVGSIEWDKSANIYASDIVIKIEDKNGNFIGILKAVTPAR